MLAPTDILVPKNLHEIARLCLRKIGEVPAEPKLVKQAACSGAVGVPATPNPFAIVLIANDQLIQRREIELELPTVAQRFNCFDEHDVSRSRTEARIRRGRNDEEFSGFKMRGRFQFDLGEVRDGIFAAARHLPHLLEDQAVEVGSRCRVREDCGAKDRNKLSHEWEINGKFWKYLEMSRLCST